MSTDDIPEMDFSGPQRRLRIGGEVIDHHQAMVRRRFGPVRIGMTSLGHTPELAYAASESQAGRTPRQHPRWYQARPDQAGFWGLWALFMLGFCGYCIDNSEWYGVVLFAVLTLTSLFSAIIGWMNRGDRVWQIRADIARLRNQPRRAPAIAQKLSSESADNPEALGAIADWAYEHGELRNAEEACRRYVAAVPEDSRAWLRLADIQLHRAEPDAALQSLARAHGMTGVDANRDVLWRTVVARLMNGEPGLAHRTVAGADQMGLTAGDRDWIRYLDALAVGAGEGSDGRAEATRVVTDLAESYPNHPRFQELRDALVRGDDIAVGAAGLVDCGRISEPVVSVTAAQPQPVQ